MSEQASEMIRVARLERPGLGWYVDANVENVCMEARLAMTEGEVGESLTITVEEMSREKYEALPEFTGW